jgi:Tol biopolymer transport system component
MKRKGIDLYALVLTISMAVLFWWVMRDGYAITIMEDYETVESSSREKVELASKGGIERIFWNATSDKLFFSNRPSVNNTLMTILRRYNLLSKGVEKVTSSDYSLHQIAINGCEDIAAPAFDRGEKFSGVFLFSEGKPALVNLHGFDPFLFPAWLNCNELAFVGASETNYGVFLWNKSDGKVAAVTPFTDSLPPDERRFSYKHIAPSFVANRFIFDYNDYRSGTSKQKWISKLAAADIETGKTWDITTPFGENESLHFDGYNWLSSRTEDAVYYFVSDSEYYLDSLWKTSSKGSNATKILDGSDIGRPYWHTSVSWSTDGRMFVFHLECSNKLLSKGIYLVNTGAKEIRKILPSSARSYALSPDGEKLAYVPFEGTELFILDTRTLEKKKVYSLD